MCVKEYCKNCLPSNHTIFSTFHEGRKVWIIQNQLCYHFNLIKGAVLPPSLMVFFLFAKVPHNPFLQCFALKITAGELRNKMQFFLWNSDFTFHSGQSGCYAHWNTVSNIWNPTINLSPVGSRWSKLKHVKHKIYEHFSFVTTKWCQQ